MFELFKKKCLCGGKRSIGYITQENTDKRLLALEQQNRLLWKHLKIWIRPSNESFEIVERNGLGGAAEAGLNSIG